MRRIILTTGGTGGHIFPALAVAEEIRQRDSHADILFIGSNYGPEKKLAEQYGLQFKGLPVRGVLGRGLHAPAALGHLALAIPAAIGAISKFKPQCMAGFGSYASFAAISAAILCGLPVLLHEQNAIPGTSNKILGRFAKKICVSLPHTSGFPAEKCVLTGNPVRSSISALSQKTDKKRKSPARNLLVLGGSQGAHALNSAMVSMLDTLKNADVSIRHQTGQKDWAEIARAYEEHGYSAECAQPFIDDMAGAYGWADLVLCRSGATTVAEICAAGVPAVFVPFPAAIHDHQTRNAEVLVKAGAARLVRENEIEHLRDGLPGLLNDPAELKAMSGNALGLARPEAAANVVNALESLIKQH